MSVAGLIFTSHFLLCDTFSVQSEGEQNLTRSCNSDGFKTSSAAIRQRVEHGRCERGPEAGLKSYDRRHPRGKGLPDADQERGGDHLAGR
eukprot:768821-Hanusia_phi.AAC.4